MIRMASMATAIPVANVPTNIMSIEPWMMSNPRSLSAATEMSAGATSETCVLNAATASMPRAYEPITRFESTSSKPSTDGIAQSHCDSPSKSFLPLRNFNQPPSPQNVPQLFLIIQNFSPYG